MEGFRRNAEAEEANRQRRADDFSRLRLMRLAWGLLAVAFLRNRENKTDREVSSILKQQGGGRTLTRIVYI
jgi:hypothetical protein